MHAVRGNVVKGIRDTWYVMDGAEIVSRHAARGDAERACGVYQRASDVGKEKIRKAEQWRIMAYHATRARRDPQA